jgi:hypothetical protein
MIAPQRVYTPTRTEPLPDLRALISRNPAALYAEARELAWLLRCTEAEAEEARRWVAEDGLEVFAA